MNRFGHVGFTLLLLSPFMSKLGTQFVLFSALFAVLPDIDIVLKVKHREYTHNVTFGAISTLIVFVIFKSVGIDGMLSLSAFVAVSIHIIANYLTMQKFPPFYPFSKKRVAFRIFRSNNAAVNILSFTLGSLAFIYFASGDGYGV